MSAQPSQMVNGQSTYLAMTDASIFHTRGQGTEVGAIPQDWERVALRRIAEFITKGSTPTTYGFKWENAGVLFLRSECVSPKGLDLTKSMFISPAAHATLRRSEVRDGDLLITITGNVGRVVLLQGVGVANINQHIARIRVASQRAHMGYVYHFLSQAAVRKTFESITTGQAYPQISLRQVRDASISLPQLPEQRAIAEALSDVDGLLGALDALIDKNRAIKWAAMQQLLTGKTRLSGFSGEWCETWLRELARDFIVPMRDKPKRFGGDVPWCRIEDFDGIYLSESKANRNVDPEIIQEMNLRVYPVGTLLVSCSADLGRCAIVSRPLVSNQTFIGLVFNREVSSNLFFYYYMTYRAKELNTSSSGTTIAYLGREQFEEFPMFVPVDLHEQVAIAAVLSEMDAKIAALEARRDKTRAIKQGMMQQLLTGRVRLVRPEPAEANA